MRAGAEENEYRGEVPPELRAETNSTTSARHRGVPTDDARSGKSARAGNENEDTDVRTTYSWSADPEPAPRRPRSKLLLALIVLLLLPVSVPLGFRAADGGGPTPVPQLLAFLPWFLAPGWLALVLSVLGRRWLAALWAVVVLALTTWFIQPYGADAPAPSDEPATARFRILTANLEYGQALDPMLETLRRERPQLVAVQECDRRCAERLRSPEMREAYPHRVIVAGSRAEGSALLSTYPLRSTPPVEGELSMPGAYADIAGTRVHVQVAHPMPPTFGDERTWRAELANLHRHATEHADQPALMVGDFNSSQDHAVFRDLLDTGLRDAARLQGQSRTPTWPTLTAPPLGAQLDHVLLSERFQAADATFVDLAHTDHRALLVDLKLY